MRWLPFALATFSLSPQAQAKLRVVTTIETLAQLVREVGADRVDASSLSHGYEDPHFVQSKPSLVVTLNRADAVAYVGLELEVGWLPPLIQQSRNAKIQQGQPGNIDCSQGIQVEDVPTIAPDKLRALGDIHPLGNPHYWIPPKNALGVARLIANRLIQLDPSGAAEYRAHLADFEKRLAQKSAEWQKRAAPLRGVKVVSYHKSWSYVAEWLGMQEIGYLEPKPGVPPSTQHTAQLITLMQKDGVKLILEESFYPRKLAQFVADKSGARLAVLPSDVGAEPSIKTYFDLGDAVLAQLLK